MATKKFASLETIQAFLDGCKTLFANITHKHTISDITDYAVDSELSSDSTNPVQNVVVNTALEAAKSELLEEIANKSDASNPVLEGSMGLNHTGELGFTSVSLGFANEASGMYCFSEGMGNKSTGDASHSEGTGNVASGMASHAEGYGVLALETGSHAEGANTKAIGYGSHAEGSGTIASGEGQHVEGKYNIADTTSIHIVGNGTSDTKRSNAHTLDLDGNAWYAGTIKVGGTSYNDASEVALKSDIEEAKSYADTVKNDLLNGAGEAYDTLKELGELIDENTDAIEALNTVATNKADKSELANIQTEIDGLQESIDSIPQSDWNQNNSSEPDYIKNRTHWADTESTILVDETVDIAGSSYTFNSYFDIQLNNEYTVIFDGTTYECVGFDDAGYNTIGAAYGDYSIYPFGIYVEHNRDDDESNNRLNIFAQTKGSHTVKIISMSETVHKLDEKFIPDSIYDMINGLAELTNWNRESIYTLEANIENKADSNLITVEDIDAICSSSIVAASEVTY